MEILERFLSAFGVILGDAGLWLLAGFIAAGFLHEFVPQRWLARQLGRRGAGSVFKGALIGVPLPLCSCSVIPAAAALRSSGASKGAAASFAVATPEIDVPAFSLTWALLGPVMAVSRVIGAAVSAVTAGLLVDAVSDDSRQLPIAEEAGRSCCSHGHAADTSAEQPAAHPSILERLARALRYGFVDLPIDLAGWLVIGLLLSAAVGAFLPASLLEGGIGDGPLAIMAAMSLGLVVYVCATGSTPLVAVLVAKGLGPGPALAFLLAGPATNPATMVWVLKDLGRAALVAYVASIAVVAFLSGFGLQWLAGSGGWTPSAEPMTEHAGGSAIGGGLLAALLTFAVLQPPLKKLLADREPEGHSCCSHATSAAGPSASTD